MTLAYVSGDTRVDLYVVVPVWILTLVVFIPGIVHFFYTVRAQLIGELS